MKKKSILALLLAGAMSLSLLAGCTSNGDSDDSGDDTTTTETTGQTRPTTGNKDTNSLSIPLVQAPTTLDPQMFALQAEDWVLSQIYEPLLLTDNDGNQENVLIDDMTIAEDYSSITFTLKSDVKFHNGDVLTAEDVVYSWSRGANSSTLGSVFPYFSWTADDDTHVTVNADYLDAGLGVDQLMAYLPLFMIVDKSYCEGIISDPNEDLKFNCNGTGAYQFDSMDSTGNIVLKRFEDYHGEASIDTINYLVVTGSQELAFESGDVDYAMYAGSTFKTIETYENVYAYEQAVNGTIFMMCNCVEGSKTYDINVREAIAHLVNREDVAKVATDDSGEAAYNMANPMVDYYADCCTHYELDVDKANELMTAAGYSDTNKCELNLIVMSAYPEWVSACEIIKENLEQSYFTVNIEEVADTTRYMNQDYDLAFISVGLTTSFASYSMLFDISSGLDLIGISAEDAQPVTDAFAAAVDEETTHTAMNVVVEQLGYQPMAYTATFLAFDKDLTTGAFYTAIGAMFFRQFSWNA